MLIEKTYDYKEPPMHARTFTIAIALLSLAQFAAAGDYLITRR